MLGLTKRLELLFRTVFALPSASMIGLDCRSSCSGPNLPSSISPLATSARNCSVSFVSSVFPAPDSPLPPRSNFRPRVSHGRASHGCRGNAHLMTTDWLLPSRTMLTKALLARPYTCGGIVVPTGASKYFCSATRRR